MHRNDDVLMPKKRKHLKLFNYVALVSLLITTQIVVYEALKEVRSLKQAEQAAVVNSTALANERLQAYLNELRSRIELISYREIDRIRDIFTQPDNSDAADQLKEHVLSLLPEAFAATVASVEGAPMIPDFDGLVGSICEDNIRHFAQNGGEFQVRIHPNPLGHHFDIMTPFNDPRDGHRGIFFVSFRLGRVAKILQQTQLDGHKLILLFKPESDLIEVHSDGARESLTRDIRLSPAELDRLMERRPVEGTLWQLVDLPEEGLLAKKSYDTITRYAGYLLLLAMMLITVVIGIRRETKYRKTLELTNQELERRVTARTAELKSANQRIGSIIENASDAIVTIRRDQTITLFNPGAERMFGYHSAEVLGKPLTILLPEKSRESHQDKVADFGREGGARAKEERPEIQGLRRDGSLFPIEATICKMELEGEMYFTAFVRDISERKAVEEKIRLMAMTDPLTGLANRHHFENKLREAMAHSNRTGDRVGLLLLDLDDFKPVNDTYGHQAGDALLKRIADVLKENLREVDVVGRLGGDEFSVVLSGLKDNLNATAIAQKLLAEIAQLNDINGHPVQISASIGISVFPDDGGTVEQLLATADKALYAAKAKGKHAYCVYNQLSA